MKKKKSQDEKTEIDNLITQLKEESISIPHEENQESITILHDIGKLRLEFHLDYSTKEKVHDKEDLLQPEDSETIFENDSHEDICIYKGDDLLEPSINQLEKIFWILHKKLY